METSSLFPLKYRLRKTDEPVEIVAWDTAEKGARSENDWVSYIDTDGNEHIKEHLTLEWDFVIDSPLEGMMKQFEPMKLPELDPWESRRYELAKHYFFEEGVHNYDKAVEYADEFIAAMKKPQKAVEASSSEDAGSAKFATLLTGRNTSRSSCLQTERTSWLPWRRRKMECRRSGEGLYQTAKAPRGRKTSAVDE